MKEGSIVICPNCSTENSEGTDVCQQCGFHFSVPAPHGIGKIDPAAEVDVNTSKYDIVDDAQFQELPTIVDSAPVVKAVPETEDEGKLPATKPFDGNQQTDASPSSVKDTDKSTPPDSPAKPPSNLRLPEVTTFEQGLAREGSCPYCDNELIGVGAFCPHCGQNLGTDEDSEARYCVECNTLLVLDAKYCHACGTEQPVSHPILRLVMQTKEHPETVEFTFKDIEDESVIGRTIEQRNHYVEIDLSPFGAKSRGVSRRHARIHFDSTQEGWQLTDIGSQFGTFVNNLKLEPNETVMLEDGQTIRLGGMNFRIVVE
jgi:ribosomal protein L40E